MARKKGYLIACLFVICPLLSLVFRLTSAPSKKLSVFNPDPSLLKWSQRVEGVHFGIKSVALFGQLLVPLVYDDSNAPLISLEVRLRRFAWRGGEVDLENPAPRGLLFLHCGGPGSSAACADDVGLNYAFDWTSQPVPLGFDIWSISQRGLRTPFPLSCNSSKCPCSLSRGTPFFIDPEDEAAVSDFFENVRQLSQRCFSAPEFQLKSPKKNISYNILNHVGTENLAFDLDLFRQAVGASKMSLVGLNYGANAVAVFASLFPDSVSRLVLNGNLYSAPDGREVGQNIVDSFQSSLAHLLETCENQPHCVLTKPSKALTDVLVKMRSLEMLSPLTNKGLRLQLNPGMMAWAFRSWLSDPSGHDQKLVLKTLAMILQGSETERESAIASVLDFLCPSWRLESFCTSFLHSGSLARIAINGVDLVGRVDVATAMSAYKARKNLDSLSLFLFLESLAEFVTWKAIPAPVTLGSDRVAPLIVGNLYDTSTSYTSSHELKSAFPQSRFLTWQGVGQLHPTSYDAVGSKECLRFITEYLKNGTFPCQQQCPEIVPLLLS